MKSTIDNPIYQRMLKPQSPSDRIEYLDFMIDFYFRVMIALRGIDLKSQFREQMSSSLQMMFTKGKAMRSLLDGYIQKLGSIILNSKPDHTILFTIVRAAYEQLCAFELVYMIPDTDDKKIILENAYVAAAQVNRLKAFTEEGLKHFPEEVALAKQDVEDCKNAICETKLYQELTEIEQKSLLERIFKRGEYQIVFTTDGKLNTHVGWDDIRDYCKLNTDALHGVYKYACNMAHPSYLALIQFHEAYGDGAINILNDTAVMQMIAIMSVYIMDFIEAYPEAKHVYEDLDDESKFMVSYYSECFRNDSENAN